MKEDVADHLPFVTISGARSPNVIWPDLLLPSSFVLSLSPSLKIKTDLPFWLFLPFLEAGDQRHQDKPWLGKCFFFGCFSFFVLLKLIIYWWKLLVNSFQIVRLFSNRFHCLKTISYHGYRVNMEEIKSKHMTWVSN